MTTSKEYENPETREFMYGQLKLLMVGATGHISQNDDEARRYYNLATHRFIQDNAWELLFPLDKEFWPEKFLGHQYLQVDQMKWPAATTYCYMMDVIAPPCIPFFLLHFGYAVLEGKLTRCTFYVVQQLVPYQSFPQGMVIDPLAHYHGVQPSFYIGCPIEDKKYIEDWMTFRKNPLEMYVRDKNEADHKQRIRDSYLGAYFTQMQYEPGWFPPDLIDFAKKEGLHIPPQQSRRWD